MARAMQIIIPAIGLGVVAMVIYLVKLLLDRQHNAKKAENHVWIQEIPKAGKEKNFLVPVTAEGGISIVKVPDSKGKISEHSPTHILGESGEFSADWPPGKTKFVQATVQKLVYYEGDSEPLSNILDRPVISAQLITNLMDGISTASAEAMRKSWEESSGTKLKKSGGLLWLYILIGLAAIINIISMVFTLKNSGQLDNLYTVIKQALGLP